MKLELSPPLPAMPSEALREALADFDSILRTPGYAVGMDWWMSPASAETGLCKVCLAGAVMAKRCGTSRYLHPPQFETGTYKKFLFLNAIRQGQIWVALHYLETDSSEFGLPDTLPIPPYETDPEGWRKRMGEFVDLLQGAGL